MSKGVWQRCRAVHSSGWCSWLEGKRAGRGSKITRTDGSVGPVYDHGVPTYACRPAHHVGLVSRRTAPAPTLANIMGWASSSAPRSGLGMACAHSPLSGEDPASPRLWDTSLALCKDRKALSVHPQPM